MGIKEILAARKAAAEANNTVKPAEAVEAKKEEQTSTSENLSAIGIDPAEQKKEPAPAEKVMTFAEKMALKRKSTESLSPEHPPKSTEVEVKERILAVAKDILPPTLTPEQQEVVDGIEDSTEAQAYTDIVIKINQLSRTDEEKDLSHSMAELKKALHKNPNAALLLLDSDIGQMVIALRKLTQTELVAASDPKKPGVKKQKTVSLTPEQIQAAWDEL